MMSHLNERFMCVRSHVRAREIEKEIVIYEDEFTNKQKKKSTMSAAIESMWKVYMSVCNRHCRLSIVVSVVKLNTKNFCAIAHL